jgi:hypothetical protein
MPVAASISVARVGVLLVIVAIGPSGEAGRPGGRPPQSIVLEGRVYRAV